MKLIFLHFFRTNALAIFVSTHCHLFEALKYQIIFIIVHYIYHSVGFVKPTVYNIFSYILFNILIDAIKPNMEKKTINEIFLI